MKKALCVLYYIFMAIPIPFSMITWLGTIMAFANIGMLSIEDIVGASFLNVINGLIALTAMLLSGTYLIPYIYSLDRMKKVKRVTFSMFLPVIHIVVTCACFAYLGLF